MSSDQGDFIIASLAAGPYRLEVQHNGYKKYVRQLTLGVNQEIRLDISLEIGLIAEEGIVTAPQTQLRKDSSALGTIVENRHRTRLPLDGRNFLELSLLVPGA